MSIFSALIIFLAFVGFVNALNIYHRKHQNKRLVCPIGSNCEAVIHSEYSKFLGASVEVLGAIYYAIIGVVYGVMSAFPLIATPLLFSVLLLISIGASFFSLYLIFIQLFVIKEWCMWCVFSAILSLLILILSFAGAAIKPLALLKEYHTLFLLGHVIAVMIGVGGATIADILFFRFLKDFKISKKETNVLRALSDVLWLALAILIVTGIGLYLPQSDALNSSSRFIMKIIVVGVIVINGIMLNLFISPKLLKISFGKENPRVELLRLRRAAFALGAISITSWYFAFFLGFFRKLDLGFNFLTLIYSLTIALAILASQFMEYRFAKKAGE